MENTIKNLTSLAKRRGFVFQSSEIYGGVEALWDYGPLGALLKNNIKQEWLKTFVHKMEHVELLESSILMHPKVWEASGHVENFTDPMLDCRNCKSRFRADHMKEGEYIGQGKAVDHNQCPQCGSKNFTEARQFNLMFETHLGAIQDAEEYETEVSDPYNLRKILGFLDFKKIIEVEAKGEWNDPKQAKQACKDFLLQLGIPYSQDFETRKANGGRIWAESPGPEQESTFFMELRFAGVDSGIRHGV